LRSPGRTRCDVSAGSLAAAPSGKGLVGIAAFLALWQLGRLLQVPMLQADVPSPLDVLV
jgi:hypothetical protein